MALGGILMGFRVTETMAHKVTEMNHLEGFAANLATSTLVIATAIHGFPVSTTHVSASAIMGMGARKGLSALNMQVVREILLAWLITVPVAGMMAVGACWALQHF
jgi:PiT family inorganic phosphate transporter